MSTVEITKPIAGDSARLKTALVLAYYLLSIGTGAFLLFVRGAFAVDVAVVVLYLAVTVVFYCLCLGVSGRRGQSVGQDS